MVPCSGVGRMERKMRSDILYGIFRAQEVGKVTSNMCFREIIRDILSSKLVILFSYSKDLGCLKGN